MPRVVVAFAVLLALAVTACGEAGGERTSGTAEASPSPGASATPTPGAAPAPRDAGAHMTALQAVADAHDDTRAAGTAGDRASRAYVTERLRAAGWAVREQPVSFPFFDERRPPVLRGAREGRDFQTLAYSGSGRVAARIARVRGQGCSAADYRAVRAGRIAVVDRGTCTFASKVRRAAARGAVAIVVVSTDGIRGGTLGEPGARIPALLADADTGAAIRRRGRASLRVDAVSETRRTANVLASRPGRGETVMAGAHLDSVPAGPGANDNASGTAALLAAAERLGETGRPVTLGFWGAEELGLLGSEAYVDGLSRAERRRVAAYVNLDMVATPRGRLRLAADDAGLRRALRRAVGETGLDDVRESARLDGGSDHASFARAGVPSAFLFTGLDRCYHRRCDTADNADPALADRIADAVRRALARLAA